jgi:hypothetical protein
MMQRRVKFHGDLVVIAQDELGTPAEVLLRETQLGGLEKNFELEPVAAAAMSGAWVVRRRPFRRRNLEIGYRFMRLLLNEAGAAWPRPEEDADRIRTMLRLLESEMISEARFAEWVCLRVATA